MRPTPDSEPGSQPDDAPPPDEPSGSPRPRHFSMLRSLAFADLITLGNAAAGTSAILLCLAYVEERHRPAMWTALALFPVALVCDVLDGFVARWRHKSSPYGKDLDSLADIVSFGVAPAVLGFALGLRGGWDAVILTYFVACGIGRLARFNVTAPALMTKKGKVSHFEGTPIPTSLVLVVIWAVAFATGHVHESLWWGVWQLGPWQLHPLAMIYAVSGSAMVSATLKIPKP